jgi:hypothetical protein
MAAAMAAATIGLVPPQLGAACRLGVSHPALPKAGLSTYGLSAARRNRRRLPGDHRRPVVVWTPLRFNISDIAA